MFVAPPPGIWIVQPGDTLQSIAAKVLHDVELWPYLASINGIASPYKLIPGMPLKVGIAEVEAEKKKVIWPLIAGGSAILAGVIYWRKDITAFFKRIF